MVIPPAVRRALAEHARAEAPNEACGLVVLRDGVAERYVAGRNRAASPYRFELEVDPDTWFLEDEGYELAVFHSHPATAARPSRTDVENVGLWQGRLYLILSLATGELAAFTIEDAQVGDVPLSDTALVTYPEGWSEIEGALERTFKFRDFAEALAFVNRLAEAAEEANHHPDIEIHWNRVKLRWWTHVKQAITERDHEMAARTNELAAGS